MVNLKNIKTVVLTVQEMLMDRGYKLTEKKDKVDISEDYVENNCMLEGDKGDEKMIALFYDSSSNSKIGLDAIKRLMQKYELTEESNYTNFILVVNNKLTYRARKEIDVKGIDTELFLFDELYVNIMKHELQPEFRILKESEKKKIEKYYKNKIPFILKDDMVVRYFNAKIGDVFEIIRRDGSLYYRMVVLK